MAGSNPITGATVNNKATNGKASNNKSSIKEPSSKVNAPTMNNTSKQALAIENNTKLKEMQAKQEKNGETLQTGKEAAGMYEVVSENYILLLGITSALIIIILIYFFSETFRVGRTKSRMTIYKQYLQLSSLDYGLLGDTRIGDYYVSSAYNAAHVGYQMYDYTSEKIVLSTLQSGARYLEFNLFNSEFGSNAYPVVSMGYKSGEWKMMITDTPLETIYEIISKNAFKIYDGEEGVDNPDDPLFIGLNLNTNSNLDCLNLTAYLTTKYFGDRLLPNTYSFQNSDAIADIKMSQLIGKVVLFASNGFQGSGLEEIVNYSWDNTDNNPNHALKRLHYSNITVFGFNKQELIDFNRKGFTIIVPHKEGEFFNTNYNPELAFELGCQFVAMEFQYIDANMDYYITKFKNKSFILKNVDLQAGKSNRRRNTTATTLPATSTATTRPATSTATTRPATITTRPATATATTRRAT
jgi:hypothetical protein